MKWLVSDQGPHFRNLLMKELTDCLRVGHHFTTAYSPWSNGSVERIFREVLRSCRALLHEFKLSPKDCPSVTKCIQSLLNQAPLKRLGPRDNHMPKVFRTSLDVFTGCKPTRPLLRALPISSYRTVPGLSEVRSKELVGISETREGFEQMHREVLELSSRRRQNSVSRHNAMTNVRTTRFEIRDFVLVRRAHDKGHKLKFMWCGPRRIVNVKSAWVYVVQNILSSKQETVHARRLMKYKSDIDGKEVDPGLLSYAEHLETSYQDSLALRAIRARDNHIEILVEWDGLPDELDQTWEPLQQVSEDLPGMLQDFLCSVHNRTLKTKALTACSLE